MGTNNSCKTAAVVGLLSRGRELGPNAPVPAGGPGSAALSAEQSAQRLNELAKSIRAAKERSRQLIQLTLDNAMDIGRWLTEAKTMVPHGEWGKWLEENVEYSQSKAQNHMRLYQEYGTGQESLFRGPKSQALGDLSVTKALRLLAIPDGPEREEFLEAHDVASMSTRELDEAIKERNEALKAAEAARAEQAAAEAAREKMSDDMKLANERMAGLTAEVEARTAQARERQEEITRITAELEELRNRPVEVAVEADAAAVEAARKEAEEAMRDKLDQAKAAEEKAREDAENAANAVSRKEQELRQALAELEGLRAQAEKTEERAALAANGDFVLFRTLFDQVQALLDRMRGVMANLRESAPEPAEKMSKALLALSDKIREVALG